MIGPPVAMAGGALIFIGFLVILFFVLVYSYYTKTGSGIEQRPSDGETRDGGGDAPGAAGESRIAGVKSGEQNRFDTHGAK